MTRPAAYLDECMNWYLVAPLRQRGFSITTARDAGMLQANDTEQLAYATRIDAILITYDSLDYRRLHRSGIAHGGIITVSNTRLVWQELRIAMLLDWAATFPERRSRLFRWHDLQQQFIQGSRLAGYGEEDVRIALGQAPGASADTAVG
jgi:predicted nuclease of predicted toxin-antitoxin system